MTQCNSCSIDFQAVTAKYEAEFFIREAQSKVAIELTYPDYPLRQNSHEVAELAMGVLGSIRHYLEDNGQGITVPGLYTAAIFSRVVVDKTNPEKLIYAMDWEVNSE